MARGLRRGVARDHTATVIETIIAPHFSCGSGCIRRRLSRDAEVTAVYSRPERVLNTESSAPIRFSKLTSCRGCRFAVDAGTTRRVRLVVRARTVNPRKSRRSCR